MEREYRVICVTLVQHELVFQGNNEMKNSELISKAREHANNRFGSGLTKNTVLYHEVKNIELTEQVYENKSVSNDIVEFLGG